MKNKSVPFFSILFLVLFFIFPENSHSLFEDEGFAIEHFTSEIRINPNSSLDIVETIEVNFSEARHGIFRDIHDEDIDVEILDVTDEKGKPWKYVLESKYLTTRIRIGDADKYVNGREVYRIHYTVYDAVRFFGMHNELYWNATGTEWPTRIQGAKTLVTIPESIEKNSPDVRFRCFTGPITSQKEDCSMAFSGNTITYTANSQLGAFEGMSVVAGVPLGHITPPATLKVTTTKPPVAKVYLDGKEVCETDCSLEHLAPGAHTVTLKRLGYQTHAEEVNLAPGKTTSLSINLAVAHWFRMIIIILQVLFILVVLHPIYRFIKYGKDPKGKSAIIAEYGPPDNLSPAEMGTLVDERADLRDISATIIDMAVRGFITIRVIPKKGFFKKDDYEFIRLKKPRHGEKLTSFEQKIMRYIFDKDEKKKLSDLEYTFSSKLPALKDDLYKSLVARNYFTTSPEKVRNASLGIGLGTIFAGLFLMPVEAVIFGSAWSGSIVINGIIALILYRRMPKKTKKGMLAYQQVLGFEEYLTVAEKYRLEFEEKENLFFEFLPYAMTLGVAEKWSKAFKHIYEKSPEWIEGLDGEFKPIEFVNTMGVISHSITKTLASTYTTSSRSATSRRSWSGSASSGSSGFSSHGSSGGGFGGGGGGSW